MELRCLARTSHVQEQRVDHRIGCWGHGRAKLIWSTRFGISVDAFSRTTK
jgi:hypothetical protein